MNRPSGPLGAFFAPPLDDPKQLSEWAAQAIPNAGLFLPGDHPLRQALGDICEIHYEPRMNASFWRTLMFLARERATPDQILNFGPWFKKTKSFHNIMPGQVVDHWPAWKIYLAAKSDERCQEEEARKRILRAIESEREAQERYDRRRDEIRAEREGLAKRVDQIRNDGGLNPRAGFGRTNR